MKKSLQNLSLQWRLTLVITFLVTVTCILMYFFISHSAVTGIDNLEDYIVQINETSFAASPITFHVDPETLFPELSNQIADTKSHFQILSIFATVLIVLSSSICTYFITRQALAPLRSLSCRICETEVQNLSEPLKIPETNDEISQLTRSFNAMLQRLNEAFTTQKQFSASAAHELRTPLAVMQTNLEVFSRKKEPELQEYRQIFNMIQKQTKRLSHLAEMLLDLTGVQSVERSEKISLAELTDEVFCDLASVADQKDIQLIQEEGDCIITGSYLLIYRAVYNLVENAIKYNRPSGTVTVSVHTTVNSEYAVMEIHDTGIGISSENQEKIFSPFFRVDKSRSRAMGGAGLGLALVAEIVQQHQGIIKVKNSTAEGTIIEMFLPISKDAGR